MRVMYELLVSKPECEARLLAALVNKLGDPARQVASKAVYLMMQLLSTHPVMKPVVVREVRDTGVWMKHWGEVEVRRGGGPSCVLVVKHHVYLQGIEYLCITTSTKHFCLHESLRYNVHTAYAQLAEW